MWPGKELSDLSLEDANRDELIGRKDILRDVRGISQGMWLGYLIVAIVGPSAIAVNKLFFSPSSTDLWWMLWAALLFVGGFTASVVSFAWFQWANNRLTRVEARIEALRDRAN